MLFTVRIFHITADGHQYGIIERLFHSLKAALAFSESYKGTGTLEIIED